MFSPPSLPNNANSSVAPAKSCIRAAGIIPFCDANSCVVLTISAAISVEPPFILANDAVNDTASLLEIPILVAIKPILACVPNVAASTPPNSDANSLTVPAVSSKIKPNAVADIVDLFNPCVKLCPNSLFTSPNLLAKVPIPITNAPIAACGLLRNVVRVEPNAPTFFFIESKTAACCSNISFCSLDNDAKSSAATTCCSIDAAILSCLLKN